MNFIEINPADAATRGIESGDLVSIESKRVPHQKDFNLGIKSGDMNFDTLLERGHIVLKSGQFSAVAIVTPATKKGVTFCNFLDKKQPFNAIAPRYPDPMTMNYNFKIATGRVKKIGESPYKKSFSHMSLARRDIG